MTIEEKIKQINILNERKKQLQKITDILDIKNESYVSINDVCISFKKQIPSKTYADRYSVSLNYPTIMDKLLNHIDPFIRNEIQRIDDKINELIK